MKRVIIAAIYLAAAIVFATGGYLWNNESEHPATRPMVDSTKPKPPEPPPTRAAPAGRPETNDWIRSAVTVDRIPGVKLAVDVHVRPISGQLPGRAELRAISDQIAEDHPGFRRYFVTVYVDGLDAVAYATAHRDPETQINFPAATLLGSPEIPEQFAGEIRKHSAETPDDGAEI